MKTMVAAALLVTLMAGEMISGQSPPQKFVPNPVKPSDLTVRLEPVGQMPTKINPNSPVVAGADLLLVDEGGYIYRWDGAAARELLSPKTVPTDVAPISPEPLLNVAANAAGSKVYVVFVSSKLPKGLKQIPTVRAGDTPGWYVVYEYAYERGELSRPRPIIALQARWDGHLGGGLTVLEDGALLFAVGDNGDSYEDGLDHSQALDSHLAKIVRIDTGNAQVRMVARGVRNAQRLVVTGVGDEARLVFIEDGGWVAEELNSIRLKDLLTAEPANFGWGRAKEDGKSREGTFYIDRLGNSIGKIPAGEPGFIEPVADFGRVTTEAFGSSGPVISQRSFSRITALFGDLVNGGVFAITGPLSSTRQDVFQVQLVDDQQRPITVKGLAAGARPDPRFFNYPDGSAGLLIERTGQFYRLTEVGPVK
jgi:hypothetical protein